MSHSVAHPKSNLSSHIISQLASKSDLKFVPSRSPRAPRILVLVLLLAESREMHARVYSRVLLLMKHPFRECCSVFVTILFGRHSGCQCAHQHPDEFRYGGRPSETKVRDTVTDIRSTLLNATIPRRSFIFTGTQRQ